MNIGSYTGNSEPTKPEDHRINFGRYKGQTLRDILMDDAGYLDWLNGADLNDIRLKDAVQRMCVLYDGEIEQAISEKRRNYYRGR